jgi:hypothetical protein
MTKRVRKAAILTLVLVTAALAWAVLAQASDERGQQVRGGGTSIVAGGMGAPTFTPIITKFAFSWRDGQGHFECLALAPSAPAASAGSGNFDTNIMYVTGKITSAQIQGHAATLKGSATVTGAGAGSTRAFTFTVTPGGPGATLVLDVSGLTFNETVLEGEITL